MWSGGELPAATSDSSRPYAPFVLSVVAFTTIRLPRNHAAVPRLAHTTARAVARSSIVIVPSSMLPPPVTPGSQDSLVAQVCNDYTLVYFVQASFRVSPTGLRRQMPSATLETGRAAQRRRTRKAIVTAAAELLASGVTPSMAEVADAAEVSRRTVYMYFPTLEQLLIDASLASMVQDTVDAALDALGDEDDVEERVATMVRAVQRNFASTEQQGRTLLRLTVDRPDLRRHPNSRAGAIGASSGSSARWSR